jgi:hypothetical protein
MSGPATYISFFLETGEIAEKKRRAHFQVPVISKIMSLRKEVKEEIQRR